MILDVARRVVEEGGIEALTMRNLSTELGLAHTAIYWHVGGREQLLNSLVDHFIDEMRAIHPIGSDANGRICSVLRQIRSQVMAHPRLTELTNRLGRGPAMSYPAQVVLAQELTTAGLKGEAGAKAMRSLLYFVGGFIMQEGRARRSVGTSDLWREAPHERVDDALAAAMTIETDTDELFEHMMKLLVDGALTGIRKKRSTAKPAIA
jgi:TetR/AcrR family transcriptional regulator, tetracycline repressor protein